MPETPAQRASRVVRNPYALHDFSGPVGLEIRIAIAISEACAEQRERDARVAEWDNVHNPSGVDVAEVIRRR